VLVSGLPIFLIFLEVSQISTPTMTVRFNSEILRFSRPTGRPKKTWREIVEKDCKARGLNREDAMDRSRWRRQIGIFDDHDGCEWVNVSSGTGSPGLSRTKSIEP